LTSGCISADAENDFSSQIGKIGNHSPIHGKDSCSVPPVPGVAQSLGMQTLVPDRLVHKAALPRISSVTLGT